MRRSPTGRLRAALTAQLWRRQLRRGLEGCRRLQSTRAAAASPLSSRRPSRSCRLGSRRGAPVCPGTASWCLPVPSGVQKGCRAVVVTLGAAGALVAWGPGTAAGVCATLVPGVRLAPAAVVDTTGAGDAFAGASPPKHGAPARGINPAPYAHAAAGSAATFYALLTREAASGRVLDIPSLIEAIRRAVFVAAQVRGQSLYAAAAPEPACRCPPLPRSPPPDRPETGHAVELPHAGRAARGAARELWARSQLDHPRPVRVLCRLCLRRALPRATCWHCPRLCPFYSRTALNRRLQLSCWHCPRLCPFYSRTALNRRLQLSCWHCPCLCPFYSRTALNRWLQLSRTRRATESAAGSRQVE